jgi:general L-amino acid transport system permease protein
MTASLGAAARWMRANLFNSPLNGVLSLVALALVLEVAPPLVRWAVIRASFVAADDRACLAAGGACWAFIADWFRFLVFGRFPYDEQWRPAIVIAIFLGLLLASCNPRLWNRWLAALWPIGLIAVAVLMWGGVLGLPYVETELWNGVPLTLVLAAGGLGFGFPLAILLALARRSAMPAVRVLAVVYIEVVRGVPFIAVLFTALVLFPLFLPGGTTIAKLWRAEIAFALFFAAYLAEVVRGGLQAIPRGQYEAAQALGIGYWRQMRLVILPQALTIAIPALVNIFIGAFKDTTLISIIGMFDPLQDTNTALNAPAWRMAYAEGYIFVAAIYFGFCYLMSLYSRRLETRLARSAAAARTA